MRIFIGYDSREPVAYHVLAHSIMRLSKEPVSITPLILSQLPLPQKREGSTEFTRSRFLVPWLCGFKGTAVFMDCDMLARAPLTPLYDVIENAALALVKHDYSPRSDAKFLGQEQTAYPRKNWSSFMVFNNALCPQLTPDYVRETSLIELHQFKWCGDHQIGALDPRWNHLVGEEKQAPDPFVAHFTRGGPWFPEFADCEYADEWRKERSLMLGEA